MGKTVVRKEDSAGALGAARDMVGQLQEQAKNGQIDGSLLDQLQAILNVSVDQAEDQQSTMESEAGSVTDVASAPSAGASLPPESELVKESDEDSEMPMPSEEEAEEEPEEVPSMDSEVKKSEPLTARPGGPTLRFDKAEDVRAKLPEFIKAMESGRMGDAQKIAGGTGQGFDTMFNAAQHALLDEGGWTSGNLSKLTGLSNTDPLAKSITSSSVPGIYLIRLAKLMLPVYAGLTKRLPTESPKTGSDQAIWKAQLGFGSLSESSFFRIAEANIGVEPPTSFLTFTAPYNDLSVNDSVTLKALRAGAGYSDPLQIGVIKAMSALLRGQERVVLGSNSAAISAVSAVTIANTAVAQTVMATGSYMVAISALTYEGWLAQSKGGSGAIGETAVTAGAQFVLGAGSSVAVSWPAVPGAVAYNVYCSGSGAHGTSGSNARWNQTVLINKATISALSTGTLTPPTSDSSANATYGYEGIISWCESGSAYGNAIPNKQTITDNAGGALTAGNGGITQFDTILASLWSTWHTAPSLMVMSPNMNATLVGKLQSLGSGTFYRVDVSNERNTVQGGMMVTGYVNKFAPFADGTPRMIDVMPHPYMPDGTVLFLSETIPYPMGNESRGFVRDVLLPYTYFPLPSQSSGVNTITYNFAITTSEVVECFNPGPQAALVGVDYTA